MCDFLVGSIKTTIQYLILSGYIFLYTTYTVKVHLAVGFSLFELH